jgi:hypothetical protein
MKSVPLAIGLTVCFSGISFAQAPGGHKATTRIAPRPSPAELRRCALPHRNFKRRRQEGVYGAHSKTLISFAGELAGARVVNQWERIACNCTRWVVVAGVRAGPWPVGPGPLAYFAAHLREGEARRSRGSWRRSRNSHVL